MRFYIWPIFSMKVLKITMLRVQNYFLNIFQKQNGGDFSVIVKRFEAEMLNFWAI